MTEKELKAQGFAVIEGAYVGTNDDVAGTWYVVNNAPGELWDKRGRGHASKAEALAAFAEENGQ